MSPISHQVVLLLVDLPRPAYTIMGNAYRAPDNHEIGCRSGLASKPVQYFVPCNHGFFNERSCQFNFDMRGFVLI